MSNESQDFPFKRSLSLDSLIQFWEGLRDDDSELKTGLAVSLLSHERAIASLRKTPLEPADIEKHSDVVDVLMSAVIPPALHTDHLAAAVLPFTESAFFSTSSMEESGLLGLLAEQRTQQGADAIRLRMMRAYNYILWKEYGIRLEFVNPVVIEAKGPKTALPRYFQMDADGRFVTVRAREDASRPDEAQLSQLLEQREDLDLWRRVMPPEDYELTGFVILRATDITHEYAVSGLKNLLLQRDVFSDSSTFDEIERTVEIILRRHDLRVGLVGISGESIQMANPIGRSLLISGESNPYIDKGSFASRATRRVTVYDSQRQGPGMVAGGLENLLLLPLESRGEVIGILEIGSPRPGEFDPLTVRKLEELVPLFRTAVFRHQTELEDQIDSIIKEQCTAIHPTVEWKFRSIALDFIKQQAAGNDPKRLHPIIFEDVYPLFGVTDIRESSIQRSDSIRQDLLEQLGLAMSAIVSATSYTYLPVLDEIGYRITQHIDAIDSSLTSGDELYVHDYLKGVVEPMFSQIELYGEDVKEKTLAYWNAVDEESGIVSRRRREFEESVNMVSETIRACLDPEQEWAQKMHPHYFEMFKTDGIEHSVYVGQSLAPDKEFTSLQLRNLRLWQIMMMCKVVKALADVEGDLPMPLQSTHLILVQDAPVSIQFRYDENRFDIYGSFNIRYEIIKKRIDKAVIAGTEERLTLPGHIAIVYSQSKEEKEYRGYIDYLTSSGVLMKGVQDMDLEEMPGALGLKALRVQVNTSESASVSELMPEAV